MTSILVAMASNLEFQRPSTKTFHPTCLVSQLFLFTVKRLQLKTVEASARVQLEWLSGCISAAVSWIWQSLDQEVGSKGKKN